MKDKHVFGFLLTSLLLISLAGCGESAARQQTQPAGIAPVTGSTALAGEEASDGVETSRPGLPAAGSAQSAGSTPMPTQLFATRPPSGWTIFSNPDFVTGVTYDEHYIWGSTLGGVVAWDLETKTPTLYTTRDGVAEIQSNDITVCPLPENSIVVAHDAGILSVYDLHLKKWGQLPITFDDGTSLSQVTALFCDVKNSRLLVGSSLGLGIYDLNTHGWSHLGVVDGLMTSTIRAIDVVGQSIWVAAGDDGAYVIMGRAVFPFNGDAGFPAGAVNDLAVAPDTSVWLAYPTGLVRYYDRHWNYFGTQSVSNIFFNSVDRVEVGSDQLIWMAGADSGVCPFDRGTLSCSTYYSVKKDSPITDLVLDPTGVAYAGTQGSGILVLRAQGVEELAFNQGRMISNQVFDIAEDRNGALWIATDRGANLLDPREPMGTWSVVPPEEGKLAYARVTGLQPSPDGVWFFYDQAPLVSFFDGSTWMQLDSTRGVSGPVHGSAIDQLGYVWFAAGHEINVWDRTLMRTYSADGILSGSTFRTLYANASGMWVGTDRGLLNYQRFKWNVVLPDLAVNAILEDEYGNLLLGTDQGLVRFDGKQSYVWIINLGTETLASPKITSMAVDRSGVLWVGTDGDGLLSYNGKTWQQHNTATGLPSNSVRKVYADRFGALWIAASGRAGGALVRYMP